MTTTIKFVNSAIKDDLMGQIYSGSPGYKIGAPLIVGLESGDSVQRYFRDEIPFKGISIRSICSK
jgi:hypothetical protein